MPLNNPKPGFNYVPEFQVSAIPWVTSSSGSGLMRFDFPYVSSFFTIKNTGLTNNFNVGFSQNGVAGSNNFNLAPGESYGGDLRVCTLWASGSGNYSLSLIAGLTFIPSESEYTMTGSLPYGVQGVG